VLTHDRFEYSVYGVPRELPDALILNRRRALGIRIVQLRSAADLTQDRVIDLTGIPRSTYQRIEAGLSDPPFSRLLRIAAAVDVPLIELLAE
jgi:DNA-binding XRE family transcriptional regulator